MILWTTALAQTVEVVPLEGSKPGLGHGLAALIESDLELIPTIELDQVGDQKLGGQWTIKDRVLTLTLVLSGDGGSATIESSGPVGDFLTVQKQAVLDLVTESRGPVSAGVQRRVLGHVETENLEALTAFGDGLRLIDRKPGKALAALERAIELAPDFSLAFHQASLLRVDGDLSLDDERDAARLKRNALLGQALAKTPEELTLKRKSRDVATHVELQVRFTLLAMMGRTCDAQAEMEHYLIRHDGKFPRTTGRELRTSRTVVLSRLGLGRKLDRVEGVLPESYPDIEKEMPNYGPSPFVASKYKTRLSLLNTTLRCTGLRATARVEALKRLQELVAGLAKIKDPPPEKRASVHDLLTLAVLRERARSEGLNNDIDGRLTRVQSGYSDGKGADEVNELAERTREIGKRRTAQRQHLAPYDEWTWLELADAGPNPECPAWATKDDWVSVANRMDTMLSDGMIDRRETKWFGKATRLPQVAHHLGCLQGQTQKTEAEVRAWATAQMEAAKGCAEQTSAVKEAFDGPLELLVKSVVVELVQQACVQ